MTEPTRRDAEALAPESEALPFGERDYPAVLKWWQERATEQGKRAENAEARLDGAAAEFVSAEAMLVEGMSRLQRAMTLLAISPASEPRNVLDLDSPEAVERLDRILRHILPADVVFALRPTGDPFTGWAQDILAALREPGEHDK